ncbi:MAG: SagB/ThcOx family dehydrogenase [Ignavibacteria bacterium]|jgi:SagB-type dehydrogenase family enzyme|nr:SagB/ThcOx family dehydrogenase [Ignavibacteria bacterium]MCU7503047.1 SagB/ThcOx family dehydrogenase [Ignavibacteria bacterium]MCU7516533.1 SagB/ThcOx family dehydrogenase [Ignavibacteria bacterium]
MLQIKVLLPLVLLLFTVSIRSQDKIIKLPEPQKEIGKPLMQALSLRQSTRTFSTEALSMQDMSNLLWAAFGINRSESGKRTAPSAMNWQEIDIYAVTAEGTFLYNAKDHSLLKVSNEDLRPLAGKQDFVKVAPLNLVYVSDMSKTGNSSSDDRLMYTSADCGFIAQNVYLYCASEGLAVVVRGMVDREALSKKLNLKPEQKIILSQTVGYMKK